jgi:hypothetical protein
MSLLVCGLLAALWGQTESSQPSDPAAARIEVRLWLVETDRDAEIDEQSPLHKFLQTEVAPADAPTPPAESPLGSDQPASPRPPGRRASIDPGEILPLETALVARELKRLAEMKQISILCDPTLVAVVGKETKLVNGGELAVPVPAGGTPTEFPARWVNYVPSWIEPVVPLARTRTLNAELHETGIRVSVKPLPTTEGQARLKFSIEHRTLHPPYVSIDGVEVPCLTIRAIQLTAQMPYDRPFLIKGLRTETAALFLFVSANPVAE